MAPQNWSICAPRLAGFSGLSRIQIRRSARIRTQGRSSLITLCVSRHGQASGRNSVSVHGPHGPPPLTAGHPGTAGNAAGHLPVRATLAAGSPPPLAGEGPVPDVCPEGSGRRPRRSGSLEAIRAAAWLGVTYRGKVVSCGRAAPPRHRVPVPGTGRTATPGGRLVFGVLAALAELIRDSSRRGSRRPAPRPCSTAGQWRCWAGFAAHPAPRSARSRPAPGAPCRRRSRSHLASGPRLPGWYGGRPRHCLICCWMTCGAGRASTV